MWVQQGDGARRLCAAEDRDMPLPLSPTLRARLAGARSRPLAGIWVFSGSPVMTEICASVGFDWLLIDMEHSPNDLRSVQTQLQVAAAYPVTPVVRVPSGGDVTIKQVLDLGAQNILIPMVHTAQQAEDLVCAVRYPPRGRRGVGSALARSGRWGRIPDYLATADEHTSLLVQVESLEGVHNAGAIAAVDGVDGIFVGPGDLAASMGLLGQEGHLDVVAAVRQVFQEVQAAGTPVGVNAFAPDRAAGYADDGVDLIVVGADVSLMTRGAGDLAARWVHANG